MRYGAPFRATSTASTMQTSRRCKELPCCHLYSVIEGSIQDESAPDWFQRIQNRPSPATQGARRRDRIVFIDFNGPGCALVKVQVQAPSGRYSDYLSMLKFNEGWRIVAKVFAPYEED